MIQAGKAACCSKYGSYRKAVEKCCKWGPQKACFLGQRRSKGANERTCPCGMSAAERTLRRRGGRWYLSWRQVHVNYPIYNIFIAEKRHKNICYCNYYKKYSRYNVCTPHKLDYDELEKEILKDIKNKCKAYLKTSNFENLLKNSDKMTKIQLDLEKQLAKTKNEINQQTIFVDRLYKDKLKGIIDEEMFKRQYNNLTEETLNLKKKANEIETKLYNVKNKVANKDNIRYTQIIEEYLSLKKPSKKMLSSLIDKIVIDEDQNVNICYKIKPLY